MNSRPIPENGVKKLSEKVLEQRSEGRFSRECLF